MVNGSRIKCMAKDRDFGQIKSILVITVWGRGMVLDSIFGVTRKNIWANGKTGNNMGMATYTIYIFSGDAGIMVRKETCNKYLQNAPYMKSYSRRFSINSLLIWMHSMKS